ncbi:MAG: ribosome biogenesis GTPase Der [Nisaea sp.]|jgi:GTP-binding protein|uniref:ribosome biogenesis GTPase Der n=1 Tax=Nisaea sp. TaxID=2024842 RepID=UPI001B2900BA|nr:ribosome biogenesis GTPase Der [Nisaea sp.]MBO6560766.1 ribosome biogenesis GTPase Der [Nisaea sp.]
MSFTVAIIGRPNVGKSTLFNRLVGKRIAIVDDQPGVTRDRREGEGRVGDLTFRLFDTAGLEDAENESLEGRMRLQTEAAVAEADAVLFVIDARAGVTPLDDHFARWLRRVKDKVILVANKCEGRAGAPGLYEAFGLGLGDPVPLSAEHGEGLSELYDALDAFAPEEAHDDYEALAADAEEPDDIVEESPDGAETWIDAKTPDTIRLAIVGRPNVGKSTFVNALLGEDRMLTGPEAGITRDAIESDWEFEGRPFKLFDTAGLRRRSKVTQRLEYLSGEDTRRAIQFAHVVVLMLDATTMLEKQDLTIARMVIEEGRALVIAANKWDIVEDREKALGHLRDRLQTSLPQVKGIPYITISAERGRNLDKLLKAVVETYETWNRRVSTSRLNRWLQDMTEMHPPPLAKGRRIKLRYMTQIKTRPPTFAAFVSQPTELPEAYIRYLVNGLRDMFKLSAVPIRFYLRGGKNPYVKDD